MSAHVIKMCIIASVEFYQIGFIDFARQLKKTVSQIKVTLPFKLEF